MKKITAKTNKEHRTAPHRPTPARIIFYCTSFILSFMYICAILLILLPKSTLDPVVCSEIVTDLLAASFRVTALGAIFMTLAAALSIRYPDPDK